MLHSGLPEDLLFLLVGCMLYLVITRPRHEEHEVEIEEPAPENWNWPVSGQSLRSDLDV